MGVAEIPTLKKPSRKPESEPDAGMIQFEQSTHPGMSYEQAKANCMALWKRREDEAEAKLKEEVDKWEGMWS